ncbi:hypothetical protein BC835DRAFT_1368665 [Cytidiella melzeri]|nr:hypothetical protein BC835DRAFT_1368665 [Cytidiella melzeri]
MLISALVSGVIALTGAASAFAIPRPLVKRDSPSLISTGILSPNEGTTWTPGQQVSITWNTSEIHSENGTLAVINLYNADDDYPTAVAQLAANFPSNTGSYSLTVPSVANGCYYIKSESYLVDVLSHVYQLLPISQIVLWLQDLGQQGVRRSKPSSWTFS